MRTYYWYLTAYFRKHGWLIFTSVIVAIIFFSLTTPLVIRRLDTKPHRFIGVVGDYSLNNLPPVVQQQLSRGLTKSTPDGSFVPDLAERWQVEDNGKTYRFILRKNIDWQDGRPLVPTDVKYSFPDVEVIYTQNDIVFKLPDLFAPFPGAVSQPLLRTENRRYWFFFTKPTVIGLGQYKLQDYITRGSKLTQLTLENSQEKITYRFYLTENEAIFGFKLGEVDYLPELTNPGDLMSWPTVTTEKTLRYDRYLGIFFNNNNPLLTKNVRQALAYALPKPAADRRATGPISPLSWAHFDGGKTYDFNQTNALERLLSEIPSEPLTLELTTISTFQSQAEQIKKAWEEFGTQAVTKCQSSSDVKEKQLCPNLGITINLRINNYPDTSNFQILLIGQESPPDPDQYYLWHSDQSTNFTRYKNTRIDSLLEKGRQTLDQNERRALYQEFQQFFLEDVPVVFLEYLDSYAVSRT